MSQAYESLAAELHDAFQDSHGPSPELPLMQDFLGGLTGRCLEIGCGSGRLLLPLRQLDHEIEGLELSEEMLAMAAQGAKENGLELPLHHGDMSTWRPAEPYLCLLAPSFTLQLAADPMATLKHWASWLQPGGGLYLTVFMPYGELTGELPENEWYLDHEATLPNGDQVVLETRHQLQVEKSLLIRDHRYSISGRPTADYSCRQTIRWAEPSQWQQWLNEAGFNVDSGFLDWDPQQVLDDPGPDDFDGILTFLAKRT